MIETIRHLEVFSNFNFGERRIDVIGCGATGSRIVLSLAKLGIENIHVWDDDTVEAHNIANQAFGLDHIGHLKVETICDIVEAATKIQIHPHPEKVDGTQALGEVVFLLTDTMSSRKEIFNGCLKLKPNTKLVVETRMGSNVGRIYAFNPMRPQHIRAWEQTLYDDSEAAVSACGATISVGPTAEIISGLAVWQMIRWFQVECGNNDDVLDNAIEFSLQSMFVDAYQF